MCHSKSLKDLYALLWNSTVWTETFCHALESFALLSMALDLLSGELLSKLTTNNS